MWSLGEHRGANHRASDCLSKAGGALEAGRGPGWAVLPGACLSALPPSDAEGVHITDIP